LLEGHILDIVGSEKDSSTGGKKKQLLSGVKEGCRGWADVKKVDTTPKKGQPCYEARNPAAREASFFTRKRKSIGGRRISDSCQIKKKELISRFTIGVHSS